VSCSPYRRGRLRQIEKWLRQEFPTPFPTWVRVVKPYKDLGHGESYRLGNKLFIVLSRSLTWHYAIDTLLHEWAHAVCSTFDHVEADKPPHDDQWALTYGKIYRAFFDNGGWIDSRYFPVEKKFRRSIG